MLGLICCLINSTFAIPPTCKSDLQNILVMVNQFTLHFQTNLVEKLSRLYGNMLFTIVSNHVTVSVYMYCSGIQKSHPATGHMTKPKDPVLYRVGFVLH